MTFKRFLELFIVALGMFLLIVLFFVW